MNKYLDALRNIYIGKSEDTKVSIFDLCKRDDEPLQSVFGVDESSRTPSGFTIYLDDYFIRDLEDDIRKRTLNKSLVMILITKLKRLFLACNDGLLTKENERRDLFFGKYSTEVRIGRLDETAPYRSLQIRKDDNIILHHLFQHNIASNAYSSLYTKYDSELTYVDDVKNFDSDTGDSTVFDEVLKYFSNKKFTCSDDVLDLIQDYIKKNNIKNINDIRYKLDNIMEVDVDELEDIGLSQIDILNDFKRILNESSIPRIKVTESLLTEANRQQLLQKSRKGRNYSPSNQYKGRNRYERRMKSSISATVRDYNMIQMDPLFKRDILEFKIPVIGETDVYTVDVRVDGLLAEIRRQLMANKGELEFKVVLQSLMKVLNMGDVYIGCNCPDARYRQAYWQTSNDYKAGYKERRPSNITNPNDDLGAGCKHVLLILANLDWAVKVASVVNNYIKYCKEHLQRNYADYIFPKVYGVKYDKAVQLNLFDNGLFPEDRKTMDTVIDQGFRGKDAKGKFAKGNEFRFQKKEPEEPDIEDENPLDLKLSNEEEPEEETPEIES